jgi:hypothetical protein
MCIFIPMAICHICDKYRGSIEGLCSTCYAAVKSECFFDVFGAMLNVNDNDNDVDYYISKLHMLGYTRISDVVIKHIILYIADYDHNVIRTIIEGIGNKPMMTSQDAARILLEARHCPHHNHKLVHVISSFVVDYWNLKSDTHGGVAECYYNPSGKPTTFLAVIRGLNNNESQRKHFGH